MRGLIWFRNDLRMMDNPALYHASSKSNSGLIALYIITPDTWRAHHKSACQVDFILKHLKTLSHSLEKAKISLLIRQVSDFSKIPALILSLVQKYQLEALFFNQQYEYDEKQRDEHVVKLLKESG